MRLRRRARPRVRAVDDRMTLVEHLRELRSRVIKSVLAIALGAVVVFLFYKTVQGWLTAPYQDYCERHPGQCLNNGDFFITSPLEGFTVRMKVAGYGGLVLALPVVLWQLWRFITPGLHPHEKRYAIPFVASSILLFLAGAAIAFLTLPKALDFLIGISGDVTPAFSPAKYISLVTIMMLAFGIGFLFPVVLVFAELVGVLTPQQLAGVRRYAIVGIVIIVAVATPSGDPYSLTALSVPMILFYEISILIGRLFQRRRARAAAAAPA